MHPWVFYFRSGKKRLSDIEFLAINEFDNKLIHDLSAEFTTTGVKFTRTPASGKTFYLAKAKLILKDGVTLRTSLGSNHVQCRAEIKYNGTVIDTIMFDSQASLIAGGRDQETTTLGGDHQAVTNAIGKSMDGNAIKLVEINVAAIAGGTFRVLMMGWEEDTGTSPAV